MDQKNVNKQKRYKDKKKNVRKQNPKRPTEDCLATTAAAGVRGKRGSDERTVELELSSYTGRVRIGGGN